MEGVIKAEEYLKERGVDSKKFEELVENLYRSFINSNSSQKVIGIYGGDSVLGATLKSRLTERFQSDRNPVHVDLISGRRDDVYPIDISCFLDNLK